MPFRTPFITLHHSLVTEMINFNELSELTIPLTLSSFASTVLTKKLHSSSYSLPTSDGRYTLVNVPQLYTPVGVEMSNGLTDFIHYYLGSYHGGRNESYIYGNIPGPLFDYDLPGAYPTAMSLLSYPDYSKGVVIQEMEGVEFQQLILGNAACI